MTASEDRFAEWLGSDEGRATTDRMRRRRRERLDERGRAGVPVDLPPSAEDTLWRERLLHAHLDAVADAYRVGVAGGQSRPVVLVLDLLDAAGGEFCRLILPGRYREQIDAWEGRRDYVPVAVVARPAREVLEHVGLAAPGASALIEEGIPEAFPVLVISRGGILGSTCRHG